MDNTAGRKQLPLNDDEIATLDACYRLHGASPNWPGWDCLLPGRSKDFLLSEARRLRLYEPDNESWTPEEMDVFNSRMASIPANSKEWRFLLPRKGPAAIRAAYANKTKLREVAASDDELGGAKEPDNKLWTHGEDSRLTDLFLRGLTLGAELEPHMSGRTASEIEQRLQQLGLVSGAPRSGRTNASKAKQKTRRRRRRK